MIEKIRSSAQKCYSKYKLLPSVTIAQAILESAWGKSDLAVKYNNLFGIKALRDWDGKVANVETTEWVNGSKIKVIQPFRVYDSWDESIDDHCKFLQKDWYAGVFEANTPEEQIDAIIAGGYCTDPNYKTKLCELIRKYNLKEYDVKMKIAVRGGHNFQAMGAVALLSETHEDRKVKDSLIKYLKRAGHSVLDVTPPNMDARSDLNYGVSKANNWGADLFISIHFNKAYDSYKGALGTECWTNTNNSNAVAISKRITEKLSSLGFKNRGVKSGVTTQRLYEIRQTNMTAIIVEVCFVEATEDVAIYSKVQSDVVAFNIAKAINNEGSTPKPSGGKSNKGIVTGNGVRVRSTPSTTSNTNIIGHLDKNSSVTIFKDTNNEFYEIYFGEHGGFISKKYVLRQ